LKKPGDAIDKKTDAKNKRVKLVGMMRGSESIAIINNWQTILATIQVRPSFAQRIATYDFRLSIRLIQ
jgi:hypothetical protein